MPNKEQAQTTISDFFEEREIDGSEGKKIIKIAVRPMTEEQARQAYPYRPHSKYSESYFGGDTYCDDTCLLLSEEARRCKMCQAPIKNEYLIDDMCPDCDGRSEYNGTDPHEEEE